MKKYRLFLFFILLSSVSHKLSAQEEIYEKPTEIIDKLPAEEPVTQEKTTTKTTTKTKQQKPKTAAEMTADEKRKDRLSRLRIGGIFGFQFGSAIYLNLSPTVGYMVVRNRLELGGGPVLIYQRYQYYNQYSSYFIYGPDIYARGFIWKGLYLEGRYDLLNKPSYVYYDKTVWSSNLLLGAGYSAAIGKVGAFNISLLYNVLNNEESIYQGTFSPNVPLIVTMGFGFGIGGN